MLSPSRSKSPTLVGSSKWRRAYQQFQDQKPKVKIDFPKFKGENPQEWFLIAEKYFRYYKVPVNMKVEVVSTHLEGDALNFMPESLEREIWFWEDLVKIFQGGYEPLEFQNPNEFLCFIKQTRSVALAHFRCEFAWHAARVQD